MNTPKGKFTTQTCSRCGGAQRVVDPLWLRAERQESGVTLRAMARRLGFSAAYVSDVERGRRAALPRLVAEYEALR